MPTDAFNKQSLKQKIIHLLISSGVGFGIYLILLVICSLVMYFSEAEYPIFYYLSLGFSVIGAFITAKLSYKKMHGRGILIGICSSIPYIIFVLLISAILLKFQISYNILYILVFSFLGGSIGGISAANK